ncbi:unnamed protein product [Closterium sp. NIES-53]
MLHPRFVHPSQPHLLTSEGSVATEAAREVLFCFEVVQLGHGVLEGPVHPFCHALLLMSVGKRDESLDASLRQLRMSGLVPVIPDEVCFRRAILLVVTLSLKAAPDWKDAAVWKSLDYLKVEADVVMVSIAAESGSEYESVLKFGRDARTVVRIFMLGALVVGCSRTSVVAVGATRGTPRTPFPEGCSPSPLALSYVSATAAADILGTEDVGAASALSGKRCSSMGKGGKSGDGGSGGVGGGGSGGGGGGGGVRV